MIRDIMTHVSYKVSSDRRKIFQMKVYPTEDIDKNVKTYLFR